MPHAYTCEECGKEKLCKIQGWRRDCASLCGKCITLRRVKRFIKEG